MHSKIEDTTKSAMLLRVCRCDVHAAPRTLKRTFMASTLSCDAAWRGGGACLPQWSCELYRFGPMLLAGLTKPHRSQGRGADKGQHLVPQLRVGGLGVGLITPQQYAIQFRISYFCGYSFKQRFPSPSGVGTDYSEGKTSKKRKIFVSINTWGLQG